MLSCNWVYWYAYQSVYIVCRKGVYTCDSKEFASLSHTFDPNHRVSFDSLNMKMGSKTQSTLYENGWWVQCTQRSVLALLHQPK